MWVMIQIMQKKSLFLLHSSTLGCSPSWREKCVNFVTSIFYLSSPDAGCAAVNVPVAAVKAAHFIHQSPAHSYQWNSGPCPCALSYPCGERSERASSSPSAGSLPQAGSGEPRLGRCGPACCPVEAAGNSHFSDSGRSSSAGCLSWVQSRRSEEPGGSSEEEGEEKQ